MIYKNPNTQISTVCFTGHRSIPYKDAYKIPHELKAVMEQLINRGAYRFLAGGAMGFDTVAALCVCELKEKHPHIRLELILPCRDQTRLWEEDSRRLYDMILKMADCAEYVQESYSSSCMHERNRRLVDSSEVCIAYCAHSGGGSAYTMAYALKNNKEVINIFDRIK